MDPNRQILMTALFVVAAAWIFHRLLIDKTPLSSLWEPFDNVDDAITATLTGADPFPQPEAMKMGWCNQGDADFVDPSSASGGNGTAVKAVDDLNGYDDCLYAATDESGTFAVATTANAASPVDAAVSNSSAPAAPASTTVAVSGDGSPVTVPVATASNLGINSTTTTSTTLTTVSAPAGQTVGVQVSNGSVAPVTTVPIPGNTDASTSAIPVTSVATTNPATGANVVHKIVPMDTDSGTVPVIVSTTTK